MSSSNPLTGYVDQQSIPTDPKNLLVNKVYAVEGVLDTLGTDSTVYFDPQTNQIITAPVTTPSLENKNTSWISGVVDDATNTGYSLNFSFINTSYINEVSFDIASVPCVWILSRQTPSGISELTRGIIQSLKQNFTHVQSTLDQTYLLDSNNSLILTINKITTGSQYSFGVKNFSVKLQVKKYNDIVYSGSVISNVTTQNKLGFIENYVPKTYSINNITDSDTSSFWKCAPQPVGDAVVYFILNLVTLQTFNRLYIDPLYTDTTFNLYYSYDKSTWTPVQRDFKLRKGFYELPTVTARYLKFEFTQLTPEPYQLPFESVQRTVQVFPDWVDNYFTTLERAIPDIPNQTYSESSYRSPNVSYNTSLSSTTLYGNALQTLNSSQVFGSSTSNNPNQFINNNIADPTESYRTLQPMANKGSVYSPVSDITFLTRKFPYTSQHVYKEVDINQTWHQAYFTGIKNLLIFSTNYTPQLDYPDFTDYFLSNTNTIVSGSTTATFTPLNLVTSSGITTVSGGGYTGSAGNIVYTNELSTISYYDSFKLAVNSTDWQSFLTNTQNTLTANTLGQLGITRSTYNNNYTLVTSGLPVNGNGFNIFELIPSGGQNNNWVQSDTGGSQNLLTTPQAVMSSGSWLRGGTGWTDYYVLNGTGTLSGVKVNVPDTSNLQWGYDYGDSPLGIGSYGSASLVPAGASSSYVFLLTASGVGTVTTTVLYSGSTTVSGTISQTFTVSGVNNISMLALQPAGTTVASFNISASGTLTLSQAGYFSGSSAVWTAPLVLNGMRVSAVARIYLPNTNYGTYRCSLYGTDVNNNVVELAHKQITRPPIRTWMDLEVPFTVTSSFTNYSKFNVRLTQNNGQGEKFRIALLGIFYNPLSLEYSSYNGSSWSNWYYVTNGVNDPNALINFDSSSNKVKLRATLLQDGTYLGAMSLVPNYQQNPYYSTTPIQYVGDPKTNELSWRKTPAQRPLFQLSQELHPAQYDISVMMNIFTPYSID